VKQVHRSFLFHSWPRFAVRHPWRVLAGTAAIVAVLGALSIRYGSAFSDSMSLPRSEAQLAAEVLKTRFPQSSGDAATVVIEARGGLADADIRSRVLKLMDELRALPEVVNVTSPYDQPGTISADGAVARLSVQYDTRTPGIQTASVQALADLRQRETGPDFTVEVGGQVIRKVERPHFGSTELIGVLSAAAILLVAFGSVVAMGLPILTALLAVGSGLLLIAVGARFFTMPSFTPQFGAMIGLGVGIDYALLIVTRFREGLAEGMSVENAVTTAAATAGRSVLFAGSTVVIAMLGLWLVGISFVAYVGTAAAVVVAMAIAVALLVLPAVLSLVGGRIDRLRVPGLNAPVRQSESGFGFRLARTIQRYPVPAAAVSLSILVLMAVPLFSLRLGSSDAGNSPTTFTSRRAYDLLTQGFGPGFNGSIQVVVRIDSPDAVSGVQLLADAVTQMPGVASTSAPRFNADRSAAIIQVTPMTSPQAKETTALVHRLRALAKQTTKGSSASAYVGGTTAAFIDISDTIDGNLPYFFAAVIGLSVLLLMTVFRSVVIAVTAALMNLLAIGASFGVIVAVFQWGWFGGVLDIRGGPIESFLPMFLFAVLFGLSMDYEVFLVTRIHEEYLRSGDNSEAVARGLSVTTRLITAAAAIMVAVFLSFALGDSRTIKEFGIGLAAAIFVDATLIRLLLVPAAMQLMGDLNWWLPPVLDRLLPRFHVEPQSELDLVPVHVIVADSE